MRIKSIKKLFVVSMALAISACSSGPVVQEFPETASPREEITKLEIDMNQALANQADVLSPSNFKEAQESLSDAKKSLDKQRDSKETLHHVAKAQAYLAQSKEFAKVANDNITDVVIARRQAIAAGAPTLYGNEFKDADKNLTQVTTDIEKNKLQEAVERRSALQLAYLNLELISIKQARLGTAKDKVAQAMKEDAEKFAPRTLAIAEKSILDTDAYITANRHNTSEIEKRAQATTARAEHALKITRDSKAGKKTSSEDSALRFESEQEKVIAKQGELNAKQGELNTAADELNVAAVNLEGKQNQIDEGKDANNALLLANSDLEKEKSLNRRYEMARSQFTENEAEVYKQGNTLMIRLKGLSFPVSQAVLTDSNFPLLAKVQKVIEDFGQGNVMIEGHTDSSGGKAINDKLSAKRADLIKEYFLSNLQDNKMSISATGYGYQKPLATNKTAEGRAQNRRVDILIKPDQTL